MYEMGMGFWSTLLSPISASSIITHLNIPYYHPPELSYDCCPNDVIPPIFTHEEAQNE